MASPPLRPRPSLPGWPPSGFCPPVKCCALRDRWIGLNRDRDWDDDGDRGRVVQISDSANTIIFRERERYT